MTHYKMLNEQKEYKKLGENLKTARELFPEKKKGKTNITKQPLNAVLRDFFEKKKARVL